MEKCWISRFVIAGALVAATTSTAHHSAAMFDRDKVVVLNGTVKEFQYTSPHSWVQVLVPGESDETIEWSVETSAPIVLLRRGIKRTSLEPGETVSVRAHPLQDGRPGALMIEVRKADGSVLNFVGPSG